MAEESLPQPRALCGALDQSRDVREDDAPGLGLGHAELRVKRGEGIVRDLRLGGGQRSQQRRFAWGRRADQTDAGDQLQVKKDVQLIAFEPRFRVVRSLTGRGLEVPVAPTARAASRHHLTRAWASQIRDQCAVEIERESADRDLERDVSAGAPGLASTGAVGPCLGVPLPLLFEDREIADVVRGLDDYRAAAPTVATVGSPSWRERFVSERGRAPSTVTAAHEDAGGVDGMSAVSFPGRSEFSRAGGPYPLARTSPRRRRARRGCHRVPRRRLLLARSWSRAGAPGWHPQRRAGRRRS